MISQAAATAIECGQLLIEARKLVPDSEWHRWLRENTTVTVRTSQRWIREAENEAERPWYLQGIATAVGLLKGPHGGDIVSPPNGSVQVPPQTKRIDPRVEVKTPDAVRKLPAGVPSPKHWVPLPELSMTARQKLDAYIARLEREFDERVRAASMKWVSEIRIPLYEEKLAEIERMLNWPRNSVTRTEYKMALHPDGSDSRTKEQLEEAFRIFTHYKAKMVSDDETRYDEIKTLPRTREEMLARKIKRRR